MRTKTYYTIGVGTLVVGAVVMLATGGVFGITGLIIGGILMFMAASVASFFGSIDRGR